MSTQTTSYQVIPRKFRPQTFETVIGQEAIVTTLKNALRFDRLAHAYLFCGCRGTGKTTLARVFAKALNCQQLTSDFEPCNQCPSCTEIISSRSLDVLEIDGASNRGIDDIRQINETIGYAPASGKYKIYIIDEVHMLTKEAFNALLKTLEEPPANVKFFFATTEPHKVLPTIISRCQRFDLNRIPQTSMEEKLAYIAKNLGVECEPEALSLIAHLSEGSLRDAESLFDQVICYAEQPIKAESVSNTLGLMPKESFFALDKAITEQQCSFAFELSQTLFSSGKDLSYFLDNLIEHFRTLLVMKFNKPCFFLNPHHEQHYKKTAPLYTEEQCLYILDYLIQWQQQIAKSPFKRIGLEMILLHLIRSKNRVTFGSLVKKLSELQTQVGSPQPPSQTESKPATVASAQIETPQLIEVPAVPSKPTEAPIGQEQAVEPIHTLGPNKKTASAPKPAEILPPQHQMPAPAHEPISTLEAPPEAQEQIPAAILTPEPIKEPAPAAKQAVKIQTSELGQASSIEEILFNKVKNKLSAPKQAPELPTQPKDQSVAAPKTQAALPLQTKSRYDTLLRFAAVELEGIIKNEK